MRFEEVEGSSSLYLFILLFAQLSLSYLFQLYVY